MALDSPHPDRPAIFVCHAGLVNIELPILHEGKCLGAFTAGQVLCEEDCYPRDNSQLDVNWQKDPQLAEYYKEIPVLSCRHIENTADLMCDLAQYI
jgi:ligand-binding sensor protein